MPGRNEPCPCGSGKKYKKCCGTGQRTGQSKSIEEELMKINEEFLVKGLRPNTIIGIEEKISRWLDELRDVFPDAFIEKAAFDTYVFLEHTEDWRAFLDGQLKRHPRREVAEVLQAWKQPFLLLAQAERSEDGRMLVREKKTGRLYETVNDRAELAGQWVLGVALPFPAAGDHAVILRLGTLYLTADAPPFLIETLYENMPTEDLMKLLKLLIPQEAALTPFAQEVLEEVERFLGPLFEESRVSMLAKELLQQVEINAKKPEAVAAGIIQAAVDIGIVQLPLNQKQLTAALGVSVMTMHKYRDVATEFIVQRMEEAEELSIEKDEGGGKLDEQSAAGAGKILQIKVKLMRTSPPIWRRLQLDSRMSFADLHNVLQAAFEWDNDHLHEFRVTRTGGKANQNILIGMDEEGLDLPVFAASIVKELDENAERLEDWLLEEKDRVVYTYDFGADWEHEIVLEKQLRAEPGARYPRCLKAKGEASGEYGFEPEDEEWEASPDEMTEIVNDLLEMVHADLIPEEPDSFSEGKDVWPELIMKMAELRKLEPWKWLRDDQLFVVQDPASGTPLFASVLGAGGEEFGLAVYIGEEGYENLLATLSGTVPMEELVFSQRSLLASFSDRDELEADDLQLIKDAGGSFRGKKQWPLFRSFAPGYYPWSINEQEARLLVQVIEQTKAVLGRVENGMDISPSQNNRSFFARRVGKDGKWQDDRFIVENLNEEVVTELLVAETELARVKKHKSANLKAEYGLFFINQPVQEKPGERPYFPLVAVALDEASGLVLHQHLDGRKEKAEIAQQGLVSFIKTYGNMPKALVVTEETERLLRPLAGRLGIRMEVKKRLPEVERLKQAMEKM